MVRLVGELEVAGPNLAEIARRLHEPKEKVSYAFRSKIERNGYVVQATIDWRALGLTEVGAIVDVSDEYSRRASDIFYGMDERWFLSSFGRTLPVGKFILKFALPDEQEDGLTRLLRGMKRSGFITKVHETMRFSPRRIKPMRVELFDFKRGRWDFDWKSTPSRRATVAARRAPSEGLDRTDLAILAKCAPDATISIKEVAKVLGLSTKTAYRHARHVEGRHLIQGYRVNWTRSHLNRDAGRPHAPNHRFAYLHLYVRDVNQEEGARLSGMLDVMPFLLSESIGPDYFADIATPLDQFVETMTYIRDALEPVAWRSKCFVVDVASYCNFTPPRHLYDEKKGRWVFDLPGQMSALDEQLRIVREEEGRGRDAVRRLGRGPAGPRNAVVSADAPRRR
jgi:DNA-binding Lrp family transcriptional regulator